jgi:lysophospholipase L1-like esterase
MLGLGGAVVPAALLGHQTSAAVVSAAMLGHQTSAGAARGPRWTHTWTAMPQLTEPGNMPPAPFTADGVVFADTTLRQTVHVTAGGTRLRVHFSNAFGGAPLPLTAASVAAPADGRAGVPAIVAGSSRPLTFGGRTSVVVPVGAHVVSDPVLLPVPPGQNLTISAYLAAGQASLNLTSHPGSRTTSYLVKGDAHDAPDLPGAVGVAHWYLISGVEVLSGAAAIAIVGDSLTDGRGSTTDGNDRWPDQLFARRSRTAVLNQAAGGNRVLNDGLGPNVLARFDRDVLATSGVDRMLIFEGVNDIGTAAATPAAQKQVVDDLLFAFEQVALRAHARDITAYGATITPFGGNTGYDDPDGLREQSRQEINAHLRRGRPFDEIADFDVAARDPAVPRQLNPSYDTGDHLHLNPTGYHALAAAVPLRWLS